MHVCHSLELLYDNILLVPSGEPIRNSAGANPVFAVASYGTKAGKFPPFLRKIVNDDPQFLHVFGRAPVGL